jgi:divalent metal cation (Fe/Co/Zn/Cd) transporter
MFIFGRDMKSIWFFVGLLLTIMGAIITVSAVYSLFSPPAQPKIFSHLHPDLWWGILMLAFGLIFAILNRRNAAD